MDLFPLKISVPYSQSSRLRPVTRLNSLVLCVMRVRSCTEAIAAIIRSFGPIGVPFRARSERISPYLLAALSPKGTLVKSTNNSSISARFSVTRVLFIAPKNNSAFTTEQSQILEASADSLGVKSTIDLCCHSCEAGHPIILLLRKKWMPKSCSKFKGIKISDFLDIVPH